MEVSDTGRLLWLVLAHSREWREMGILAAPLLAHSRERRGTGILAAALPVYSDDVAQSFESTASFHRIFLLLTQEVNIRKELETKT